MREKCVRCDIDGDDVRLFDAIYDGKMESICERCSIIENIPIIKKPSSLQLRESEKAPGVFDRMRKLSGMRDIHKEDIFFIEDKLKELDEMPELELPEREKLNLIEHFHWHIMKNRRRKGLTQEQLARSIGEGEMVIQMLEKGKLPENAEILFKKLEQFFQTKFTKISETERIFKEKQKLFEPILLDEFGKELETIPEPEFEVISEELGELGEELEVEPEMNRETEVGSVSRAPEVKAGSVSRAPEVHCRVETKRDNKTPWLETEPIVECEVSPQHILKPRGEIGKNKFEDFNMKIANPKAVTIADLNELHRKKIEATREEKLEEQKRIEERQRLIQAKKEELRLLKERESKELDRVLGGVELLDDQNKIEFDEGD